MQGHHLHEVGEFLHHHEPGSEGILPAHPELLPRVPMQNHEGLPPIHRSFTFKYLIPLGRREKRRRVQKTDGGFGFHQGLQPSGLHPAPPSAVQGKNGVPFPVHPDGPV